MMDPESPSEKEQEFIAYVRRKRGPCPEHDTLIAFQQRALTPDQAQKVQAHVELCATCQLAIDMLERFNRTQAEESAESSEGLEVRHRSRERFLAFLNSQVAPSRERSSFWEKLRGVFLHPAFAYVLLVALAYPAYLGIFRKPQVVREVVTKEIPVDIEKPAFDVASLPEFKLQPAERGPVAKETRVRLLPDQPYFALSFSVPVSERPEFSYDLEIRDSHGRIAISERTVRPHDPLGRFLVVCRRDLFSAGRYELRVRETNKTTQAVRRQFSFSFTVE